MTHHTLRQPRHLLVALLLACVAGTLHAEPQKNAPPADSLMPGKGMNQQAMEQQQNGMMDQLALNEKQRELFKTATKEKMASMHDVMDVHEKLREMSQSDTYDEKKARELLRSKNKEVEDGIIKASKSMHEFYKSLTPEQKTKLNDMHSKMREKMKEHMRDDMKANRKGHMGPQGAEKNDDKDE